jgi:hypothetical protein
MKLLNFSWLLISKFALKLHPRLTLVKVQKKQVDFECKLIKQLNAHLIISTCLKPLMKIFIFYLEYFMDNFNMINHFEHLFQSLEMKKKSMNIMFFFSFFLR